MTESTVRAARADEGAAVSAVLSAAFDRDPVLNWLMRDDDGREAAIARAYGTAVAGHLAAGRRVDVIDIAGAPAAALLWTPSPGARPIPLPQLPGLWSLRAWTGLWRLPRSALLVLATQSRYPPIPHAYLSLLGVAPSQRGRGLGSRLLGSALGECDREGVPAYLENSDPRNIPLYERHGFVVREELVTARGAPPLFLMWREPR
jgi:GNAT superfamily N-acetyltransferase